MEVESASKHHYSSLEALCTARCRRIRQRLWPLIALAVIAATLTAVGILRRTTLLETPSHSHSAAAELARRSAADSTRAAEVAAAAAVALAAKLTEAKAAAEESAKAAQIAAHKKRVADRAAAAVALADQRTAALVHDRTVRLDDGKEVTFSIFGRGDDVDVSVFVLPFDSMSKRFLLVEEYHPGPNAKLFGLVADMLEAKHASIEEAVRWELSEEARLVVAPTSRLVPLAADAKRGFAQDKYSSAHFHPFLALDCQLDERPRERDQEERITLHRVTESELRSLLGSGRMNTPSIAFTLLALNWLAKNGEAGR